MTASNGGIPSDEVKNYFNSVQCPFPEPVNGKIDTLQFLEASRGVASLVDQFGNVFAPVKYDMTGNIEKINQVYSTDQERHCYLNDLILIEQDAGGVLATDALLWLRRALHMIQRFFELILEDENGSSEELASLLKTAYQETLITYHKWPLQLLFSMLCRMCPNRTRLVQVMSLNRNHTEASVFRDMAAFTSSLRTNIEVLTVFYRENQLECTDKV